MPVDLPTSLPPSRDDKATFAQRGNDAWAHLFGAWPQLNALEENVNTKEASAVMAGGVAVAKAGEALTSANNAATSKIDADTAKVAAVAAQVAAEDAFDSFDDRYLGAKADAPALDNDGNALLTGAIYFDTVIGGGSWRAWNSAAWVTAPVADASTVTNTPAGGITEATVQGALDGLEMRKANALTATRSLFAKADTSTVAFTKTGAGTISLKAGTYIDVAGTLLTFAAATAVTMPALTAGTDYSIWATPAGALQAVADPYSAPAAPPVAEARKIGGFHHGLVAAATTVAGGSFATIGNGMIWTQANVDDIAGINKFSLWDLKWRPSCDPRGMRLEPGNFWMDIYPASTDLDANGTSKYNTNIASGTVLPKIPAAFGGNGVTTYPALNWWVAVELAASQGKRLPWEYEFVQAAYGVTENQSIDATASTYPTTRRNAGYTSKRGGEQMSGHHWIWGQDSNFFSEVASPAYSWKDLNGNSGAAGTGRGQINTAGVNGLSRVLLGGARSGGAYSGSRASSWSNYPWFSGWNIGLRAACDHLILV